MFSQSLLTLDLIESFLANFEVPLPPKSEEKPPENGANYGCLEDLYRYAAPVVLLWSVLLFLLLFFVADGINSVGDYNSPPGGCRVFVCLFVSPLFFTFHDWITSKRFELLG